MELEIIVKILASPSDFYNFDNAVLQAGCAVPG